MRCPAGNQPGQDYEAAKQRTELVAKRREEMKLKDVAQLVRSGSGETLTYYALPREQRRCCEQTRERLIREIRRRTRAVGAFPEGKSALMLAAARLRHEADTKWGTRRYLDITGLPKRAKRHERPANIFGSLPGEPSITTARSMTQEMCENSWTLPRSFARSGFPSRTNLRVLPV